MLRYKIKGFIAFYVVVFLGFSSLSIASDSPGAGCENQNFTDTYFLLGANQVGEVSIFFNNLFNNYFEDFEPFISTVGQRSRLERYFDTNKNSIHDGGMELYISTEENLPEYRIGREQVVYKNNSAELGPASIYEVKRYNKKATPLDKHPLFGKVLRKERVNLLDKLKLVGPVQIEALIEMLEVRHEELVFLISLYGVHTASITLDKFHIKNYGLPNTFTLIKYEIQPDSGSNLSELENEKLNQTFCLLMHDFQQEFSSLEPISTFGYQQYVQLANMQFPGRAFFQRYPLIFTLGQILVLILIGFLLVYLLLGRYSQGKNYRVVNLQNTSSDKQK